MEGETRSMGTLKFRPIGKIWIVGDGDGDMGGEPATTQITLGFNPDTGRFVGTWIGSMMTHLWVYDGELDATGNVLTLNSEGPSMTGDGSTGRYQDVIAFEGDNRHTLSGKALTDNGWHQFMQIVYTRK
jgi:hypothetical protein